MKKYRTVNIQEVELEDLVRRAPELIGNEGLRFVDHQRRTRRGPLDVLLVDSGNALVVAELKIVEDDGMLTQGIDYYDYIYQNLDGFARAYSHAGIDPQQKPRLFLIAPSFSLTLLNRIKWIDIPLSLYSVKCVEFEDSPGEIIPIYMEINPPEIREPIEKYSLQDRFDYITDEVIRSLAKSFADEVQDWDPNRIAIEPKKYDIAIKLSGQVIGYIYPKRKKFQVGTYDADDSWVYLSIDSEEDLPDVRTLLRSCFERKK